MEYSRDNISRPSNSFWAQMGDWKESIVNFASQTAKHSLKLLKFVLQDAIDLHKNMVSWETVGILFTTLPLQQLAYKVDDPLHSLFYDRLLHKNTNQAPYLITRIGLKGYKRLRLLMIVLSIWHPSITVRATNLLVVQGSSILSITKRIIKQLINHFAQEASLRPSSERFIQGMKYYGGNPSGHITQASFALTVYGKDHGSAWLTALSIQNILTCIISIIENRHYLSQVIDGVALGTIYGLAARKTRPKWEEFLREEEREVNKSNFVHHKMSLDAIE